MTDDLDGLAHIVKPLEWADSRYGWTAHDPTSKANAHYSIYQSIKGFVLGGVLVGLENSLLFETLEDAKAVAQADYTRRIIPALTTDAIDALRRAPDVGEVARVLLAAGPLPDDAVEAAHQQIDWCRNDQNTRLTDHPSQRPGTSCAEDIQDAWQAALRALAQDKAEGE